MPDLRPICNCGSYPFPHKLGGGQCSGSDFASHTFLYARSSCEFCNLNATTHCDVVTGAESVFHGECYQDAIGNRHVTLSPPVEDEPTQRNETDYFTSDLPVW